jgi:hypothetical protein
MHCHLRCPFLPLILYLLVYYYATVARLCSRSLLLISFLPPSPIFSLSLVPSPLSICLVALLLWHVLPGGYITAMSPEQIFAQDGRRAWSAEQIARRYYRQDA